MRISDLTLHDSTNSAWDENHLTFTLIMGGILLLTLLICVVGMIRVKNQDHRLSYLVFAIFSFIFLCLTPIISAGMSHLDNSDGTNYTEIGFWARTHYVLDLTEEQAKSLYDNSSTYEDTNYAKIGKATIVSYYGKKTLVNLIQHDEEWLLFSDGQELEQVDK